MLAGDLSDGETAGRFHMKRPKFHMKAKLPFGDVKPKCSKIALHGSLVIPKEGVKPRRISFQGCERAALICERGAGGACALCVCSLKLSAL